MTSKYEEIVRVVTNKSGEEIATFKVRAKDFSSLRTWAAKDYHMFDDMEHLEEFKREKLRELLTTETPQTDGLFQQIIGKDCILVRNDDGTAMVLVKENGKWRLAE